MRVLIFSTDLSETILSLKRIQRDIITNVHTSSCKVPLLLSEFNLTFFFGGEGLQKSSNTKFHENPDIQAERQTNGRTDELTKRQDEVSTKFSQFYERAQK
jgi:hypothetical protein